ncbi:PspC domain-containing protein [Blastococcus sp. URHD0036]|uniref:PspC domain-containing protein n=1 Tax=Blastococcus sp. URHD0036 TaxID=1380356 RepID=UPI0004971D58|nr:PspC domain-containing protein [Blastococcus sp. URHD0036]
MTAAPPPAPPTVDPPPAWPPPPPPSGPPARPQARRSRDDKMVGGVAGGLADYSGIDPLLWRVGFVALTLAGGTGILVYLLLWVVMPAGPRRADDGAAVARVADAPTLPRSPVGRLTMAGVLIAVGSLVLAVRLTDWEPGPRVFLGTALLVVGLGLVAAAFTPGRSARGGLIALGVVLSLALVLTSSVPWNGGGVGDRDYRPADVSQVRDAYRLGAGDMTVDLSRIDVADIDEPLRIEIDHGVGDLDIVLPREADVQLSLDTGVGEDQVFDGGSSEGGYFPGSGSGPGVDDDEPEFVLTVDHGVGDTEVSRG